MAESDYDAVIRIVNQNWKDVYTGYVNPELLNDTGCQERGRRLKEDFIRHRLYEYVWEESDQILGLLSMGAAVDKDRTGAFEIWRVYIAGEAQGRGIGRRLLAFAENRPLAKLSRAIKIANTSNEREAESEAFSTIAVTFRKDSKPFNKANGVFNKDTFA